MMINGAIEQSNVEETLPLVARSEEPIAKKQKSDAGASENSNSTEKFDYLEYRQLLRQKKKFLITIPRLILNKTGNQAAFNTSSTGNTIPLFLSDVQDILVYALSNNVFYLPRWCTTEKLSHLTKLVVLVVEGFSSYEYSSTESSFPFMQQMNLVVEVVTPASYHTDLAEELGNVPLFPSQRRKLLDKYGSIDKVLQNYKHLKYKVFRTVFPIVEQTGEKLSLPSTDRFPRTHLLLSASQMVEEKYPLPLRGALQKRYSNYVLTKEVYTEVTPTSPMFAIDCEMCMSAVKPELTRVSVIDEQLQVVYDTLVKPERPIINYLTQYSGITAQKLKNVTTRLSDVQQALRNILPSDAILVGQSLNCDLDALEMMHPYIIDTSVIFNFSGTRDRKSKLSTFVREFLNEEIQRDNTGHCSVEDGVSSMRLVQLKLTNSIEFGDAVLVGRDEAIVHSEAAKVSKPIGGKENKYVTCPHLTSPLLYTAVEAGKSVAVVGKQNTVNSYSDFQLLREDPNLQKNIFVEVEEETDLIVKSAADLIPKADFVIAHIQSDSKTQCIDNWAENLWKTIPDRGMLVVLLGSSDVTKSGLCFARINKPEMPRL